MVITGGKTVAELLGDGGEKVVKLLRTWLGLRGVVSPTPAALADGEHSTDLGNARRLVRRHGTDLRHVKALRKWLVWDGRRWCPDATEEVVRRAKDTVRAMYAEAAITTDSGARQRLVDHARNSEARQSIASERW